MPKMSEDPLGSSLICKLCHFSCSNLNPLLGVQHQISFGSSPDKLWQLVKVSLEKVGMTPLRWG